MENLFQGGACSPNAFATSNQYKRLMTNMTMGSQNPERVMQMAQKGQSFEDEIRNQGMMFQSMNQGWGSACTSCSIQHSSTCRTRRKSTRWWTRSSTRQWRSSNTSWWCSRCSGRSRRRIRGFRSGTCSSNSNNSNSRTRLRDWRIRWKWKQGSNRQK